MDAERDGKQDAGGRDGLEDELADGTARKRPPVGVAARVYVRRGWRVVELRPRSKAPAQSGWQDMRLGEEALAEGPMPGAEVKRLATQASIRPQMLRRAREQRCHASDRAPFLWTLLATSRDTSRGVDDPADGE